MAKKSCGLYPYMFVQDDGIAFNMILTYAGSKKLDIKTVNVTADDNMYTFTCDEEYGGGYDQDLGCWFDLELFQLSDDEISWLSGRHHPELRPDQGEPHRHSGDGHRLQPDALLHRGAVRHHPDQSGKVTAIYTSPRSVCGCSGAFLRKNFIFFKKRLQSRSTCAILTEL